MKEMKVLVACEYSGMVRRAFAAMGHDVWSVDLLPALDGSNRHIVGDVRDYLDEDWALMMVAHPPCTRLCNSGVRWLKEPPGNLTAEHYTPAEIEAYKHMNRKQRLAFMWHKLDEGAALFSDLWNARIPRIAVENPVMHPYAMERIDNYEPPAQTLQPWQHGDFETKRICLWLKGLKPIVPKYRTLDECRRGLGLGRNAKPVDRVHKAGPGPKRWAERSKFFPGASAAMAQQWSM